jgi:hypothetical protein
MSDVDGLELVAARAPDDLDSVADVEVRGEGELGDLLRRLACALRLAAPMACVPGHRPGRGGRRQTSRRLHGERALPPGATGDVALAAVEEVITPVVDAFAPTWVLRSSGFDAHRDDPTG